MKHIHCQNNSAYEANKSSFKDTDIVFVKDKGQIHTHGQTYGGVNSVAGQTGDVTTFPEACLSWGGKDIAGNYSPIDAALVEQLGTNKAAFFPGDKITIEYSDDAGTTWEELKDSNNRKSVLFTKPKTVWYSLGAAQQQTTVNDMLCVTLDVSTHDTLYTTLNKAIIEVSNAGATLYAKIESADISDNWEVNKDWVPITGWSAYNVINFYDICFGGYDNQTDTYHRYKLRFTFKATTPSISGNTARIGFIGLYGGMGWVTPSNLAKIGHLYDITDTQSALFPADVHASKFVGNFEGALSIPPTININNSGVKTLQLGTNNIVKVDTLLSSDNRAVVTKPNDYNGKLTNVGIKASSVIGLPSENQYAHVLGYRGHSDYSGGYAHEIAFSTNDAKQHIFVRSGSTTEWNNSWQEIAFKDDILDWEEFD